MHILKTDVNQNPNVGLYGYATDSYCILGLDIKEELAKEIGEVLKVPVHRMNICGTSLVGVFLAGNNNKLLVPAICFDKELEQLKKAGIDYQVIDSKLTALGNTLLCNDNGCLASEEFSSNEKKRIREALNVPLKPGTIAELDNVGSLAAMNSKACIISRDVKKAELKKVEELLKIPCIEGSINMGSPHIRSGILCNSHGFVVGDQSGGPEIVHIEESLGFLDKD